MPRCFTMANDSDRKYITEITLNEAVDNILNNIDNLFENLKEGKIDTFVEGIWDELKCVKVASSYVKDEINGLKADPSTVASRRKFEEMKTWVNKRHTMVFQISYSPSKYDNNHPNS
jgi:hypothetical protein